MALMRWDPFLDLYDLQRDMARVFGRSLTQTTPSAMTAYMPKIDTLTRGSDWVVRAELPGMTEKDVSVAVEGNVLTITGEHRDEKATTEERYQSREISYGHFERSVMLPEGVDIDQIHARLENGVLEVVIPKAAELQKAKTIPIEAPAKKEIGVSQAA